MFRLRNVRTFSNNLNKLLRPRINVTRRARQFSDHGQLKKSAESWSDWEWHSMWLGSVAAFGFCAYMEWGPDRQSTVRAQSVAEKAARPSAERRADLPTIDADTLRTHNSIESGVWVSFEKGVYDVTEFAESHPGGADKLLLAAGGPLEPFWKLYAQHNEEYVREILEQFRVGNIAEGDEYSAAKSSDGKEARDSDDPYANEPERHPALLRRSTTPFNAETPATLLATDYVTSNDLFYVRNHMPVPTVSENEYRLRVTDDSGRILASFTLEELRREFPKYSVHSTIQCAGNRRNEMSKVRAVRGGSWDSGAISNAEWSGARMRDVLLSVVPNLRDPYASGSQAATERTEANVEHLHVHFEGLDVGASGEPYAASVPVEKALDPLGDALFAYEMNGEAIPRDHGYPVRAVLPGITGARNVKWLRTVRASQRECDGHWQQKDYRSFGPNIDWDNVDWQSAPSIQEVPVTSAICEPSANAKVSKGETLNVRGYAISGGGKRIIRVDVSADGGATWNQAELNEEAKAQARNRAWAWTPWSISLKIPDHLSASSTELICRAVDESYNTQPENVAQIWNLRGVVNNSWHRVPLRVSTDDSSSTGEHVRK